METYAVIYRELNNHIRDTDKKRDQAVDMFVKITLSALSGLVLLQTYKLRIDGNVNLIASMVFAIICVFGQSVFHQTVSARKWHAEYLNAIMILQYIMLNPKTPTKEIFNKVKKKEHKFIKTKYTC
ncbi:MAG: hypothetical protein ACYCSW_10555 [bacterium]